MRRWLCLTLTLVALTGCGLTREAHRLARLEHPAYPAGSEQLKRDLDACEAELLPRYRHVSMTMATAGDLVVACMQRHGWTEPRP